MDEKAGFIFLTTLTQYGLEGYRYHADNDIIKPMKYVRLKAEMDGCLKKHRKDDSPYIVIVNDTGKYKVFLKSLRYVETFDRKKVKIFLLIVNFGMMRMVIGFVKRHFVMLYAYKFNGYYEKEEIKRRKDIIRQRRKG